MQFDSSPSKESPNAAPSDANQPEPTYAPGSLAILQGRLHPLTLAFSAWTAIRRLIIPAVPLLFFGGRLAFAGMLSLLLFLMLARAFAKYFSFVYRIEGAEIITKQGIIERTERHIPLERVQEIRIEQDLLHRIFGVADVHVETAGGSGPEASLSVLSIAEAERLRRAVFGFEKSQGESAQPQEASQPVVLCRLKLTELILAGLTSNHLVSAVVIVGGLLAFLDDFVSDYLSENIAQRIYGITNEVLARGAEAAVIASVVLFLFIMTVSVIFSMVGSVVLFYGFALSLKGEDLHRQYGLLTQRSSSLPRRRIQVLEINEGILRRLFGLATLRADTAGSRPSESREKRVGRDVLLPVVRREEVDRLLPVFFPDIDSGPAIWRLVSRKAVARGTVKGAIACVLLATAAIWTQENLAGLWFLALLPAIYAVNVMRYHNLGYVLGEHYFYTRRGWLSRSTHMVPIRNAQTIVIRRSLIDRSLGLATLLVDSAGQAYTGGGPRISNLPLKEANDVANALAHRAATTRYKW